MGARTSMTKAPTPLPIYRTAKIDYLDASAKMATQPHERRPLMPVKQPSASNPPNPNPANMLTQEEIDALREDAMKATDLIRQALADLRTGGKRV